MPRCKNCHQVIDSIDKDVCPFCGTLKPLDNPDSFKTNDITHVFNHLNPDEQIKFEAKTQKTFVILSFTLGFLGINHLYTKNKKNFCISLFVTLCVFLICFTTCVFVENGLDYWYINFIVALVYTLINNGISGLVALKSDVRDRYGRRLF